jgi:hypothetical protein
VVRRSPRTSVALGATALAIVACKQLAGLGEPVEATSGTAGSGGADVIAGRAGSAAGEDQVGGGGSFHSNTMGGNVEFQGGRAQSHMAGFAGTDLIGGARSDPGGSNGMGSCVLDTSELDLCSLE